ncbi:uncharacterized protein LOC110262580 [Arachis ipaensis]|uniref:uncharacterized protein LOC110262580 n=1 Tax=Arachis ipaensis TaxID=130454 RepID=UPI000A2B5909|nr:uncharacterized protein LOC110262580 [Arachis ipaensis]
MARQPIIGGRGVVLLKLELPKGLLGAMPARCTLPCHPLGTLASTLWLWCAAGVPRLGSKVEHGRLAAANPDHRRSNKKGNTLVYGPPRHHLGSMAWWSCALGTCVMLALRLGSMYDGARCGVGWALLNPDGAAVRLSPEAPHASGCPLNVLRRFPRTLSIGADTATSCASACLHAPRRVGRGLSGRAVFGDRGGR